MCFCLLLVLVTLAAVVHCDLHEDMSFDIVQKYAVLSSTVLSHHQRNCHQRWTLESFQDFLIEFDMKAHMHLVKITIFSLNNITVRPTKIMNRADKNEAHFQKIKYFKNQNFQKYFLLKLSLLDRYSSLKKKISMKNFGQGDQVLMKNIFENFDF